MQNENQNDKLSPKLESSGHDAVTCSSLDYSDGAKLFEGYLATPAKMSGPLPTVLLCHEWSGLNQAMKAVADRVARLGYGCLALDVYGKGVRGEETGDNSALMGPLLADRKELQQRLLAGLRAAQAHPDVDASRVAVLGYCFGGLCALDLARSGTAELSGAISVHGVLSPPGFGARPRINTKILVLHGWEDPMAPPADVFALASELTTAGADWQLQAYGHAMHAFTATGLNFPERGIRYDANADRRSWEAMKAFLFEVIGAPIAQNNIR